MNPIVMRSLGAMAPLRPKTEAGKKFGTANAAPTAAPVWVKNLRRPITFFAFMFKTKAYAVPPPRVKLHQPAYSGEFDSADS
jgi:hypothetical protein